MFDKVKFANIIKNIKETYNSQEEFSRKSGIGRTYLSQYMNMKLEKPPKPNTLKKLADSSNGITNYNELMEICDYTDVPIYIVFLQDLLDETEEKYINEINKIRLSGKELEVYFTLEDIFIQRNTTRKNFSKEINSYFDNIDWINEKSKNKIIKKIQLFIEYCEETEKIREKINGLKYDSFTKSHESLNNITSNSKFYMAPVYGRIAAGQPNWAEECIEGRLPIDPGLMNITNPEECFFLKVNGESMNKLVKNGAYALIRKTDFVDDGEIAVVLVNGYDATLKVFHRQGDFILLEPMSDDPSFKTQIYGQDTEIKVIGKYLGKMEMN